MDYYQELRVQPDPEFPISVLMNALIAKLHRALVEIPESLGISFPDYDGAELRLGERLRIHSNSPVLEALSRRPWLRGMRDHLEIGPILAVPATNRSVSVRRIQAKSNPERLRRRLMQRYGLSPEIARDRQPMSKKGERLSLPWLEIRSASTGQRFRLFVDQQVHDSPPVPGQFSSYGFSSSAQLPWF